MSFLGVKYAYYSLGMTAVGAFVVASVLNPMYHFTKADEYLKLKGYPHPIHKPFRPAGHLERMKEVIDKWPPKE